jgi:exosortase
MRCRCWRRCRCSSGWPVRGAWAAALWAWLGQRLETETRQRVRRLLPLAVLAFPWVALDFPSLGWWYRLSTAWCAAHLFQSLGFEVHREGTQLIVAQMPFDVTAACSGIKALQAMLIAGTALCFLQVNAARLFWAGFACLPLVAWLANTLRVLLVFVVALSFGPEFASGWFHTFGGWLVLVGTFGFTWFGLETLRRRFGTALTA